MRPKRGGRRRKIWKPSKDVLKPCNPLKSHKTAKDLFGKAWSETRDFWRSLEKGLEGAFIPPPLAPSHQRPPLERDRHYQERKRRSNPGVASRGPWVASLRQPVRPRTRKARFIVSPDEAVQRCERRRGCAIPAKSISPTALEGVGARRGSRMSSIPFPRSREKVARWRVEDARLSTGCWRRMRAVEIPAPLTQTVSRKSGRGGLFGVARWSIGSVYI